MFGTLTLALAATGTVAGAHAGPHDVAVRDAYFEPTEVHVDPGETVTWIGEGAQHTVTADDGRFDFMLNRGDVAAFLFEAVERVAYHCRRHDWMTGRVVVGPSLSVAGAVVREGDAGPVIAEVVVSLARVPDRRVEVDVATRDRTAQSPTDYTSAAERLVFEAGAEPLARLAVTVNGDTIAEPDREEIEIVLSNPSNTTIADGIATIAIVDDDPPRERWVPSPGYATIDEALSGAPPGTVVNLLPATHRLSAPVAVDVEGVVLRGRNADGTAPPAGAVELRPIGDVATGIIVSAGGVSVEDITIRGFGNTGLLFGGVRSFRVENVQAAGNRDFGIRAEGSSGGVIRATLTTGSVYAGVAVRHCGACDTIVEDIVSEGSMYGFLGLDAGSLVVRRSHFTGNHSGIVLRTTTTGEGAPQRGSHVYTNMIEREDPSAPAPSFWRLSESPDLPAGVGVWIAGGMQNVVETNTISGHSYGVAVTAFVTPALGNRVVGNTVSGSAFADLASDGIGSLNCFSGNADPNGAEASTDPPALQETASCSLPVPVIAPNPRIHSQIALSWVKFYCRELPSC